MFFWNKICLIGFFSFISGSQVYSQAVTFSKNDYTKFIEKSTFKPYPANDFHVRFAPAVPSGASYLTSIKTPIPADYYTRNFGFFCKQELNFEKTTKIAFRFRLGSLEQCNYYEGKK
ncbi:MAG: hypothetical protein M3Z92_14275 [Bacteroidota bacterium]|nr:hypothetical protein [Bacteroidota bacterium]